MLAHRWAKSFRPLPGPIPFLRFHRNHGPAFRTSLPGQMGTKVVTAAFAEPLVYCLATAEREPKPANRKNQTQEQKKPQRHRCHLVVVITLRSVKSPRDVLFVKVTETKYPAVNGLKSVHPLHVITMISFSNPTDMAPVESPAVNGVKIHGCDGCGSGSGT